MKTFFTLFTVLLCNACSQVKALELPEDAYQSCKRACTDALVSAMHDKIPDVGGALVGCDNCG